MNKSILLIIMTLFIVSCRNEKPAQVLANNEPSTDANKDGFVLIGKDIVTEIIIKPDPAGDPWEIEKIAGYQGEEMVNGIFKSIYNGTLVVKDYHSGEILPPSEIKAFEKEFENDRSRIGKLSFTEDWFYNPDNNTISKKVKTIAFGYELQNNEGKVFGYKAIFNAEMAR